MPPDPNNSIQEKVLSAIIKGEVKAKPKWYFYGQSFLLAGGVILSALLLLFLSSLIIFNLRQNGGWFAPQFGWTGLKILLGALPWLLILSVAALVWLLEYLLKTYKFTYQRPLLYSFVGVGLVIASGTILITSAHFHENILERSQNRGIIFGAPLYRHYGQPKAHGITRGEVTETNEDGCLIKTSEDEPLQVIITPETQIPNGYEVVAGDMIIVFGPRDDGQIKALGIKKIQEDAFPMRFLPLPPPRGANIY